MPREKPRHWPPPHADVILRHDRHIVMQVSGVKGSLTSAVPRYLQNLLRLPVFQ
jgi:hypothetical protein